MKARLWLLSLALAGCGAAPRTDTGSPTREPEGSVEDYATRIERLADELDDHLAPVPTLPSGAALEPEGAPQESDPLATGGAGSLRPRDCSAAFDLRERICDLAERICSIAEREQADRALASTCADARASCTRATADVSGACGR